MSTTLDTTQLRTAAKDSNRSDSRVAFASHTLLIIWSIIVLVPFLWTLMSSFKTTKEILSSPFALPSSLNFDNYISAWNDAGIGRFFFNTVIVVGFSLVGVMLLGAMLAYVLARFDFRGNKLIYNLFLAALTFPMFLAIVPLFFILQNMGLLNTRPGLILVYIGFALPFTMFFLYSFFKQLPNDVYEAANIDGAGEWRTFFSVMLPMAGPGMASVAILNLLGLWNQFILPVSLNTKRDQYVLSQGMAYFASQAGYSVNYGALFAAAVMVMLPVLILYILFQQKLQGSVSQGTFR